MTQYVKIPKERVGAIIGPKGETKNLSRTKPRAKWRLTAKAGK